MVGSVSYVTVWFLCVGRHVGFGRSVWRLDSRGAAKRVHTLVWSCPRDDKKKRFPPPGCTIHTPAGVLFCESLGAIEAPVFRAKSSSGCTPLPSSLFFFLFAAVGVSFSPAALDRDFGRRRRRYGKTPEQAAEAEIEIEA